MWYVVRRQTLYSQADMFEGIEMIVRYCMENFSPDLVRVMVLESLELGQDVQKGQFYK